LHRASLLLLLFLCAIPLQSQVHVGDATCIRIFELSLGEEYKYRTLPSYKGNVDRSDVLILDTIFQYDKLPELPGVRFVRISPALLDSLAKCQGDVEFTELASLHVDSTTARVLWKKCVAHYFKRYHKVAYLSHADSHHEYHLTLKGWVGGPYRTVNYNLNLPRE
jgi:hypothetical protein